MDRDTQKPILVGKGGSRIKAIGTAARKELERLLKALEPVEPVRRPAGRPGSRPASLGVQPERQRESAADMRRLLYTVIGGVAVQLLVSATLLKGKRG